ncbi:hypothetical protein FOA52_008023 [Chlamydomonas sp. UWO 241]|nr:hypothetical protein FOA52_008023 [Chlamydomonas sp. UWO 241]
MCAPASAVSRQQLLAWADAVSAVTSAGVSRSRLAVAEGTLAAEASTAAAAAEVAAATLSQGQGGSGGESRGSGGLAGSGGPADPAVERAVEGNLTRLLGELRELHGGGLSGIDAKFKEY